jgi:hypothetical protein
MVASMFRNAVIACTLAGPLFVTCLALGSMLSLPAQPLEGRDIGSFLAALFPAAIFGFMFAVIPVIIGATVMGSLSWRFVWARPRIVWALAGGLPVAGLAWQLLATSEERPWGIALIVTSVLCASICRFRLAWP